MNFTNILITDPAEIEAVRNGEIEGDVYRDGECWAQQASLNAWRAKVSMG